MKYMLQCDEHGLYYMLSEKLPSTKALLYSSFHFV